MSIFVVDTETAGFAPPEKGSGVCDFAYAEIDNDFYVVRDGESLIDPECPISAGASGVHHITNEMVEFEPTLFQYMNLAGFPLMNTEVLIGHNVKFDIRFLHEYLPENFVVLDTLKLSRIIFTPDRFPDLPDHKLQTLRYYFKLDAGTAHRALGDVITCINLLKTLAKVAETDLNGLIKLNNRPLPASTQMPFGKHRGVAIKDLPKAYVSWLLNKADIDEDLKFALESL